MAEAFFSKAKDLVDVYGDVLSCHILDIMEQYFNDSLAKVILEKKNVTYEANIKFTQLVKKANKEISVESFGDDSQKTHEAFVKIVSSKCNSIDNSAEGLAALRNDYCPERYGRSADHFDLLKEYSEFIFLQTYAVICFILSLVQQHKEYQALIMLEESEDYNCFI